MPHIHTNPGEHDFAASAFIIRTDGPEPRLLLHLHKKFGRYFHFGGHVELHEDPWQAVIHEIAEEAGYRLDQLKLLQPPDRVKALPTEKVHPQPMAIVTHPIGEDHHHTDIEYVFTTDQPPALMIDASESQDFILVSLSDLEQNRYDISDNLAVLACHALAVCLPKWEAIKPPNA